MAACVLHNICIMENDNIDYFLRKATKVNYVNITNTTFNQLM